MATLPQTLPDVVRLPWRERVRVRIIGIVVAPVKPGPRRDSRRRAIVSLGVGLALFFGIQFSLGWAVNTERNPLRDPIYFDKLVQLRKHPAFYAPPGNRPATVLFIGSSRTLNAVNGRAATEQLSRELGTSADVFNFGQAGAGPVTNAIYLRRLVKDGVKPDFAVIEIHPTFLSGQNPVPPETKWLLPVRLRPEELPVVRAMGFPAADPAAHGPRGFFAPCYEHRFLILDRYAPWFLMNNQRLNGGHESDDFGFTRLHDRVNPADKPHLLALAHRQYADYFAGYRPNGCGVNGIRDTIDVCLANGIRPMLVLFPESPTWLGWYDVEGLKELKKLVTRLGDEYTVPVIDTRTWVPEDMSGDGHHLSGLGADLFTERLIREAVAPWVKRSPP
jgi:hypothetical protein